MAMISATTAAEYRECRKPFLEFPVQHSEFPWIAIVQDVTFV